MGGWAGGVGFRGRGVGGVGEGERHEAINTATRRQAGGGGARAGEEGRRGKQEALEKKLD